MAGDFFRRAHGDDFSTPGPPFRSHFDDMVGALDDIKVVFNDDDGISHINEAHEDVQEFLDIGEVKADRRFVQDIKGVAVDAFSQFTGKLDPLGFTAG